MNTLRRNTLVVLVGALLSLFLIAGTASAAVAPVTHSIEAPTDVEALGDGYVITTDTTITVVDTQGGVIDSWSSWSYEGTQPSASGNLSGVDSVAVSGSSIYIAAPGNMLLEFDSTGNVVRYNPGSNGPVVAVASFDDTLYAVRLDSPSGPQLVCQESSSGSSWTSCSTVTGDVTGMTAGPEGIYVSTTDGVSRFDLNVTPDNDFDLQMAGIADVGLSAGGLYAARPGQDEVQALDPETGTPQGTFTDQPNPVGLGSDTEPIPVIGTPEPEAPPAPPQLLSLPELCPENQPGVTINNGARYTNDPNVLVTVDPQSCVNSFVVSNDGGFNPSTTFGAQRHVDWTLDSSGPERLPTTVYVRVAGQTLTDTVILDETNPKITEVISPAPPVEASVVKRSYSLRVKAKDNASGIAKVQVATNKSKPGQLRNWRKRFRVRSKSRKMFVRVIDKAGNRSTWRKVKFVHSR